MNMKTGKSVLLGPKEVALRLDCKLRFAYIVMRKMRHVNIGNGQTNQKLRVFEEDLDEYIASRTIVPREAAHRAAEQVRSAHQTRSTVCSRIPRRTE